MWCFLWSFDVLTQVLGKYNSMFAHIVIERVSNGIEEGVSSFAAKYGCLAQIENVRRMEVGALVSIRGLGRINLAKLTQLEPFLKGTLVPFHDAVHSDAEELDAAVEELKTVLADVQRLQIKLRGSKDELLQTPLANSLQWAENGTVHEKAIGFVPCKAESLSFVPLQPVTSASVSELQVLLQERIWSMEATSTIERLRRVTKFAEHNRSSLAAKVALQSLEF
ncbi:hypothetical protein KP509_36G014100 [Ceratopteris richardii]|uniref:Lon N-terminal domain-containing protein n=1 Tax=Ceratopteris richardii TaxID=49495 RepID=A0A8T2QAY5_CERRI|nr:hypothetical protein KP509_36G014100 [Ceratopteris richardii]